MFRSLFISISLLIFSAIACSHGFLPKSSLSYHFYSSKNLSFSNHYNNLKNTQTSVSTIISGNILGNYFQKIEERTEEKNDDEFFEKQCVSLSNLIAKQQKYLTFGNASALIFHKTIANQHCQLFLKIRSIKV